MKVRYSTNWMGPIQLKWIHENGRDWAAGRIDVHGDDVPEYEEIGLPLMKVKDWTRFTRWVERLTTPEIWTLEQLVKSYEFHNPKITWFDKEHLRFKID